MRYVIQLRMTLELFRFVRVTGFRVKRISDLAVRFAKYLQVIAE